MFLLKRQKKPTEVVRAGDYKVQFNKHAARSLGVWESGSTPR